MALLRFKDTYPNYKETFSDRDVIYFDQYSVYGQSGDKVGSVRDALFESTTGNIRYLIVDTGFWIFGKEVLLPIGLARFDYDEQRIYVDGLVKDQVENLPEYNDDMTIDQDYEEQVRNGYRTLGASRTRQFMGQSYNVNENRVYPGSAALYGATETTATGASTADYDYDTEPGLYAMDRSSHEPIRLYQERLIADKDRFKTGEVAIGKQVETKTQKVSVPVQNERVVIERTTPTQSKAVTNGHDFKEGEVVRMETHAEEADIRKEAFVREEVTVRKEVNTEVVTGEETLRREELKVDTDGQPVVNQR